LASLRHVLKHEGGKVHHPKDPGGRTNQGVTQRTYTAYRKRLGQPTRDVFLMTDAERNQIYREGYWNKIDGDGLPLGVDYCAFDYCVNSGPGRANKVLKLAPKQEAAAQIEYICAERLDFLKRLKTWDTFGKGWARRVRDCRATALSMIDDK
jgi:lysozyme family protein